MFRRQVLLEAFKVCDLLIMAFSFSLATLAIYYQSSPHFFSQFLSMRIKVQNFLIFIGFLAVWHLLFSGLKLYHSHRLSTRWAEIQTLLKATTLGCLIIYIAAIIFAIDLITLPFIFTFWTMSSAITILSRLVLRNGLKQIRLRNRNLRHMVIVGTNPRGVQFARKIEARPELGYRVLGFVDDDYPQNGEFKKTGYALVSGLNDFTSFLKDHVVDEVVISLPIKTLYDQSSKIVSICEEQGIIVRFISDFFNLKMGQSEAERFEGNLIVTVSTGAMKGWQVQAKRGFDIVASFVLLIALSPLFLIATLLIKTTSPGPAFFAQARIGLNKRRFRLYKFRTMVQGAEKMQAELEALNEVSGPVFKIRNDPRITWVGKYLRKTSIDELPQLINVLKGDMSLVGPRPLPVRDYEGFGEDWQRRRFSILPGITCLWQINGRSNTNFDEWMQLDMEYIDQWSLWLDMKILAKTLPAVISGVGAA